MNRLITDPGRLKFTRPHRTFLCTAIVQMVVPLAMMLILAHSSVALDTITRKSAAKRVAGEITEVTRTEVKVEPSVGAPTTVPANDIRAIDWDGQPPALGLAHSKAHAGQYELALQDYEAAKEAAPAGNRNLQAEIEYGIATTLARMSLADAEQRAAAITRLKTFLEANRDHYRFYDGQMLLGATQLVAGDGMAAEAAFNVVAQAPWPDYQMAAKVAIGRVLFERGDIAAARSSFDEVAGASPSNPAEASQQFEAMLGQAMCLQKQANYEEAARILGDVIQRSAADDTRLQAEAYLRQGDCYVALGQKTKEAIMAYLHLDVIPSLAKEKDLHAEALYQLQRLWPLVGQPARAAEAAGKLESLYPNSEWTRKLGEG